MRVCGRCKIPKESSLFDKNKSKKNGHGTCKQCRSDYAYNKKYGLSLKQYLKLLTEQSDCCKICGKSYMKCQYKKLNVDHCHTTHKIRGLLCGSCNKAIGLLKDDLRLVYNVSRYLQGED